MILTTTENINGKEYDIISLVRGATVHSKHIGKDIMASLKNGCRW